MTNSETPSELDVLQRVLAALPGPILIVTEGWEVAALSRGVGKLVDRSVPPTAGGRPGEALQCIYAESGEAPCGEGPACEWCRLLELARAAADRDLGPVREEIELTVRSRARLRHLPLRVAAAPLWCGDQLLVALYLEDLSELHAMQQKLADRSRALWRFHRKLEQQESPEVTPVVERFGGSNLRCA